MANKKKGKAAGTKGSSTRPLTADELFVRRDTDGNLELIEVKVPGTDRTIKVLPTTIGSLRGFTAIDKSTAEWPVEEKIRYVQDHVREPDLSDITTDEIMDNMTMWDLDMLLIAAVQAGGPTRERKGKA
jgi:hypothetical protein